MGHSWSRTKASTCKTLDSGRAFFNVDVVFQYLELQASSVHIRTMYRVRLRLMLKRSWLNSCYVEQHGVNLVFFTWSLLADVQELLQDGVRRGGPVGEEQVLVLEPALGESKTNYFMHYLLWDLPCIKMFHLVSIYSCISTYILCYACEQWWNLPENRQLYSMEWCRWLMVNSPSTMTIKDWIRLKSAVFICWKCFIKAKNNERGARIGPLKNSTAYLVCFLVGVPVYVNP